MSLNIFLLGQFKLQAGDTPFELPSRPAQSLLGYLALHAGEVHRREKLAALLWPEANETNARSYLRQSLWRIRKSLEQAGLFWENYLETSDISITFDPKSDFWLDVNALLPPAEDQPIDRIMELVRLYRGELLPGFYDEWVAAERNRIQAAYQEKMGLLLARLSDSGRWDELLHWGEQWIQLGHSPEPAFRALMTAYAALGNQVMVSSVYQRCVEAINNELGLDPSPETRTLYEKIIREEGLTSRPRLPTVAGYPDHQSYFLEDLGAEQTEEIIFVGRERELAQFHGYLDLALAGKGCVAFITGEAGSGKTALIQEFTRRAQEDHPNLVVACGNCNAHTGLGDPYLPFREILGSLSGEVEARWAAGATTKEYARRLWNMFPLTAAALLDYGPGLVDTFVPAASLMNHAAAIGLEGAEWLTRLRSASEQRSAVTMIPTPQQNDIFEQYVRVLRVLSQKAPLVLVIDDLQWADAGSIGLLFHFGRQISGNPILLMGAYRQEEILIGREGTRHPLESLVNEFQREFGAISINLEQADRREFLEAFLDSESNCLGVDFREMLHQQTQGHPLFTIELLRGMQERGDLVRNEKGQWVEGQVLEWDTLPARVEAVIAERIGRLAPASLNALQVASVEGEVFTAEVIAQVLGTDESSLLARFSGELDRKHRLIRAESIQRSGGRLVSSFRFRHILSQKYLYSSLDQIERVHYHEQIGTSLEKMYADQQMTPGIALQLARHFTEAGIVEKAIHYLRHAGERSVQLSAYAEGIAHLNKGLELIHLLPASAERDQQELLLQLAIGMAWKYHGPTPQGKKAVNRARDLCQQMGKTAQMSQVLGELSIYHYVRAEYQTALDFAAEALSMAKQAEDPLLEAVGHWYLGFQKFCHGEFKIAKTHLEQVIAYYKPALHHQALILHRGVDAGLSSLAYYACCLWCLGFPDRALETSQKALALARELNHPFSLADVLCYAGCILAALRRDSDALQKYADELVHLAKGQDFSGWVGIGLCSLGEATAVINHNSMALDQIREGMEINEARGVELNKSLILRCLAIAQAAVGLADDGLTTVGQALQVVEQTGERYWEAELYRLQAEFLAQRGDIRGAESSYLQAVQVSTRQHAKAWELRAANGLARLWLSLGRKEEAQRMLADTVDWFTEGMNTPDLQEAQALLQEAK